MGKATKKKKKNPQQAFIFLYVVKQSVRPKKTGHIQVEKTLEKVTQIQGKNKIGAI